MKPEYTDRISSYLDSEMDDTQREAFEEACRQDDELRSALKAELKVRMALHEHAKRERRSFYSKSNHLDGQKPARKAITWGAYLRVAALFLIVCVLAVALYRYNRTSDLEKVYESNFELYFVSMERNTAGDATSVIDSVWQIAGQAYQQGNWETAGPLLRDLGGNEDFAARDLAILLLGNIALAQDSTELAITTLQQVDPGNLALKYDAAWYLALAYLKSGSKNLALEQLKVLGSSKVYREKANEIREKL